MFLNETRRESLELHALGVVGVAVGVWKVLVPEAIAFRKFERDQRESAEYSLGQMAIEGNVSPVINLHQEEPPVQIAA